MPTRSTSRRSDGESYSENALDVARGAFEWLVTGPYPVALNGRRFPGLPDRQVPLDELRDLVLERRCRQSTRDAVWAHLVLRSRTEGATWTVAAVGMALPALTSVTARLTDRFAADPADVAGEVLRGFLAAVTTIDLRRPKIMLRLRWAAFRAGHAAVAEALAAPTPLPSGFFSRAPHPPWGHPDLVLARAVDEGVLTRIEAAVIGATRLEELPMTDWAARSRMKLWAAYKMRQRAEARLRSYLCEDTAEPTAPRRQPRPPRPRSVTESRGRSRRKVRRGMSKTGSDSGVQERETTPSSPRRSEVPPCA
ncbi:MULTISPECIES: hypothetical protein [unclassified Crossiella]|uniref:hypothetical protein n=1 Tax=unclassified Crossiella TaxID=2620835 RepID=UPI001FFF71B3|nr:MULTISPECIES: hypothetical protein [unclassified Crossiella]MCK2241845.1 hypothetical protein [Crossiella sp. S99.2]MCK2255748.1 hypothetical protein [Crossiella sp. S99.1]